MDAKDKAFDEGWRAAYKGYTKKDNPYKRFTDEWEQWRDGNVLSHDDDPYWSSIKRIQKRERGKIKTIKSYITIIKMLEKTSISCLRGFQKLDIETKGKLIELSAVISNIINEVE